MSHQVIVGGLLVQGARVLLGRRLPTRTVAPDVWDIFGGHVRPGERVEAALFRELQEELGIQATRLAPLAVLDELDPRMRDYVFPLFLVQEWHGVPENRSPEEHTEIRWFSADELEHAVLAHSAYPELFRRVLRQNTR